MDGANKILEFWHAVEFFQCYDLKEKIDSGAISYTLYSHQLKDVNLPWLNPYAFKVAKGDPGKRYDYHIYFLLFDRSELVNAAKKMLGGPKKPSEEVEWEEKLDALGSTCFAKIFIRLSQDLRSSLPLVTIPQ